MTKTKPSKSKESDRFKQVKIQLKLHKATKALRKFVEALRSPRRRSDEEIVYGGGVTAYHIRIARNPTIPGSRSLFRVEREKLRFGLR